MLPGTATSSEPWTVIASDDLVTIALPVGMARLGPHPLQPDGREWSTAHFTCGEASHLLRTLAGAVRQLGGDPLDAIRDEPLRDFLSTT